MTVHNTRSDYEEKSIEELESLADMYARHRDQSVDAARACGPESGERWDVKAKECARELAKIDDVLLAKRAAADEGANPKGRTARERWEDRFGKHRDLLESVDRELQQMCEEDTASDGNPNAGKELVTDGGTETVDDAWADAIETLRERYDDSYGARIELSGDIGRKVDDVPQECGHEGVLQPIIRYQQIDPDAVYRQIESKVGEETAAEVRDAFVEYAERYVEVDA